jgi:penicillin-binding protein 1A
MKDVVQRGTGVQARLNNIAVAGKTGTADKSRDIWFVGFTPDTVTAVWGGNDRYLPVRGNVTGGVVMAKIWHDFMTNFYRSHPAPADGFIPPKTPFMQQPSSSVNSSVVNDAEQYEEGLKNPPLPDPSESAQPDQGSSDGSVPAEQSSPGGGSPGASGAGSPDAAQPGVQDNRSHYVHDYDRSVDQQPQSDSSERVDQPNEQNAPRADSAPRSDQQGNNQLPPTPPGAAVPTAMPAPAPAPSPDRQPSEDARRSLERPLGYGENTQ